MVEPMPRGLIVRPPPDWPLAACIGPTWSLLPLRVPTGWAIRWNTLSARRLDTGELELNDSEDLVWAVKLPRSDTQTYELDPSSPWRELHVDAGWYRDHFRLALLDPDWDHAHRHRCADVADLVRTFEDWLMRHG